MGGHDYCAIPNCPNARHIPEKHIRGDHIGFLRWHKPKEADRKAWIKQIELYRKNFSMTKHTRVCSNHFAAGYYYDHCRIPTMYMKGYDSSSALSKKRKEPSDRTTTMPTTSKRSRNIKRDGKDEILPWEVQTPSILEHDYDTVIEKELSSRCTHVFQCKSCKSKLTIIQNLRKQVEDQQLTIEKLNEKLENAVKKPFSIDDISKKAKLVTFYTGLPNFEVFQWLYNRMEDKSKCLTYSSHKNEVTSTKPGPKRKLSSRDEFFMTLVRLRLGLTEHDIAFRFKVSQSTVSTIWNTWVPFLSRELTAFIYWPTQNQNKRCYPKCFAKYPQTIGIIDCTEGALEKPSIAKAQAQTYSSYKSKNTWKKLLCITPCGTVSFVSKAYGGSASDRYITESCSILEKLNPGDVLMADKGFNISDLLVGKGAKLVIPPFLRDKGRFSKKNCVKTSSIAKARIHVERAIARIKDFRILQGAIPLTMKDLLDDIFIIISAITNIGPPLVPL